MKAPQKGMAKKKIETTKKVVKKPIKKMGKKK